MSVELVPLVKFSREVFHIAPPVPLTRPRVPRSEFGRIGFYFDEWGMSWIRSRGRRSVAEDLVEERPRAVRLRGVEERHGEHPLAHRPPRQHLVADLRQVKAAAIK